MLLMGKSNMQKRRGFSIIELLIVMVILAITSAIGVFSWNRFTANSNLRAATAEVEADLMLLKQKAKSDTGNTYATIYDLDGNRYAMTKTDAMGIVTTIGTKTPSSFAPDIKISEIGLALVGTFTSGSATITCEKRSTLSPINGHITLSNDRGSTAIITYNVTGRTYVTYAMH
jgi:prepilin-type N-terminal cleavage/methylation domain-containing protein